MTWGRYFESLEFKGGEMRECRDNVFKGAVVCGFNVFREVLVSVGDGLLKVRLICFHIYC